MQLIINSNSLRFLAKSANLSRVNKLASAIIKISLSRASRASLIKKIGVHY